MVSKYNKFKDINKHLPKISENNLLIYHPNVFFNTETCHKHCLFVYLV